MNGRRTMDNEHNGKIHKKRTGWFWFATVIAAEALWIVGNYIALQTA